MKTNFPISHSVSTQRGFSGVGIVIGLVALILIAWGLFSRQRASARLEEDTQAQVALPVEVVRPKASGGEVALVLPGSVQANYQAPIYARTAGYLKRWLVDIGTPVKAGQVLAEIEAPDLDEQLHASEAQLANAEANLKIAQVTAERWRDLRSTDSVSQQEADERSATAAASLAATNAARANLQRLRELSGFKNIVAPFDGVITARNTDRGALINSGSSSGAELFRIADTRSLRLYVRVPQTYAASMSDGLQAEVFFPDRPGKSYTAKLDSTSSAIDASSRTLLAQLLVDNANNELLPGSYAEVHFKLGVASAASMLRVPANALLFSGDGLRVATVAGDKVVMKKVTLGRDFGTEIEIASGLTTQDQVIVAPPDSITDSTQVRITQSEDTRQAQQAPRKDAKS